MLKKFYILFFTLFACVGCDKPSGIRQAVDDRLDQRQRFEQAVIEFDVAYEEYQEQKQQARLVEALEKDIKTFADLALKIPTLTWSTAKIFEAKSWQNTINADLHNCDFWINEHNRMLADCRRLREEIETLRDIQKVPDLNKITPVWPSDLNEPSPFVALRAKLIESYNRIPRAIGASGANIPGVVEVK